MIFHTYCCFKMGVNSLELTLSLGKVWEIELFSNLVENEGESLNIFIETLEVVGII